MKVLISNPASCILADIKPPISAICEWVTYGVVSWLINNTFFAILTCFIVIIS